jgi:site-specific recombinase XerD
MSTSSTPQATPPCAKSSGGTPLEQSVKRYLMFLQSEENKSPLTVKSYRESLTLFCELSDITTPEKINKMTIRLYKQQLHEFRTKKTGEELTVRTKNHHLTVLRAYLRYLIQEEELDVYPPDRVTRFKEDPRKVKVLFKEDLERLLESPDISKRAGKRDKAILELFFSTGLRLAELCSLNVKDVNFTTREMSVRGKRGKIRLVFISPRAADSLKEYLESRVDSLTPLFISKPDHTQNVLPPGEEFRLSSNMVYRLVKKYALVAGIVSDPSPHTLRHSFATDLLRNGADLRSVQELLGHKDLGTTQIYTHVTNPQLKEVHQKFHGK